MAAELGLRGKRYRIESPLRDGLERVRVYFPNVVLEGSLAHWSYWQGGQVVAEAWIGRTRWHLVLAEVEVQDE
jgi:hypothetical protein